MPGLPEAKVYAEEAAAVASLWHSGSRLLSAVQSCRLFDDCKQFVDMPLRRGHTAASALAAFDALRPQPPNRAQLAAFVEAHFLPPGADLVAALPDGWRPELPAWAAALADPESRALAAAAHGRWAALTRRVAPAGGCSLSTLLPVPRPFVVPGDRFREPYYWDSAFVVDGLVASGLPSAAEGAVRNLLALAALSAPPSPGVAAGGCCCVPNGGRSYYASRSQPPMLARAVAAAAGALRGCGRGEEASSLVWDALPVLEREWRFWDAPPRGVLVAGPSSGAPHRLSVYGADLAGGGGGAGPRPESWREDVAAAAEAGAAAAAAAAEAAARTGTAPSPAAASAAFHAHCAAACESGWDFSSRWWVGQPAAAPAAGGAPTALPPPLHAGRCGRVVPADLNALLAQSARLCAGFAAEAAAAAKGGGEGSGGCVEGGDAARWSARAAARDAAVRAVHWDRAAGMWRDYELDSDDAADATDAAEAAAAPGAARAARARTGRRSSRVFASNWVPMACGCLAAGAGGAGGEAAESEAAACVASLSASGLLRPGGPPASLLRGAGQQWDWPNVWPPLVALLHEGALAAGPPGRPLARALAGSFLRSATAGLRSDGAFHEKYDCEEVGARGGGGEYPPQVGFGWTAAAVLVLLRRHGRLSPDEGGGGGEGGGPDDAV